MNFIDMITMLKDNNHAEGYLDNIRISICPKSKVITQTTHNADGSKFTTLFANLNYEEAFSNNWGIHFVKQEKPKLHTFEEAIAAFKDGKTIKRELWSIKTISVECCPCCDDGFYAFSMEDMKTNDWVIIE
ncbi:MAG: hypothetical protein EKK56_07815 [Flavobacteriaceae bacterium]|nr:MAG: hypothetical protein EKK56_07815 [Flavobacteriaceae bacterium]